MQKSNPEQPARSHNKTWYETHSRILNTYIKLSQEMPESKIKARDIIRACGIHSSTFYSHFESGVADVEAGLYHDSYQNLWERCEQFLQIKAPSRRDVLHLLFPGHPDNIKNQDKELLRSILQYTGFRQSEPFIKRILEEGKKQTKWPSYEDYISYTLFVSSGLLSLAYHIFLGNNLSKRQHTAHIDCIKTALRTLLDERNRILSLGSESIPE